MSDGLLAAIIVFAMYPGISLAYIAYKAITDNQNRDGL